MMIDSQQGVEMVAKVAQHWDVVVDGVQIFLCFLIIVYLFRNRSVYKKLKLMNTKNGSGDGFNTLVFTQTIKQQTDQAFANIIETIAVEQDRMESALKSGPRKNEAFDMSEFQIESNLLDKNEVSRKSEQTIRSDERHLRIQELAVSGMSAKQISEELKTPLGEVELVLNLINESH
jgi:hypothetical protein